MYVHIVDGKIQKEFVETVYQTASSGKEIEDINTLSLLDRINEDIYKLSEIGKLNPPKYMVLSEPIIVVNRSFGTATREIAYKYISNEELYPLLNEEINQIRRAKFGHGFKYNGSMYDMGYDSVMHVNSTVGILGLGLDLPSKFYWRTQDNQEVNMTTADFRSFAIAITEYGQYLMRESWDVKNNISMEDRPHVAVNVVANYRGTVGQ